jgi:hypothetical protein
MAYTAADLTAADAAIAALRDGQRISRVTTGEDTVQFQDLSLDDLRKLRGQIAAELGASAGSKPGYYVITSSKGL